MLTSSIHTVPDNPSDNTRQVLTSAALRRQLLICNPIRIQISCLPCRLVHPWPSGKREQERRHIVYLSWSSDMRRLVKAPETSSSCTRLWPRVRASGGKSEGSRTWSGSDSCSCCFGDCDCCCWSDSCSCCCCCCCCYKDSSRSARSSFSITGERTRRGLPIWRALRPWGV